MARSRRGTEGMDETGSDVSFHAAIMEGAEDTPEIKADLRRLYARVGIMDPWWLDDLETQPRNNTESAGPQDA